jgi:hypothetical protein
MYIWIKWGAQKGLQLAMVDKKYNPVFLHTLKPFTHMHLILITLIHLHTLMCSLLQW